MNYKKLLKKEITLISRRNRLSKKVIIVAIDRRKGITAVDLKGEDAICLNRKEHHGNILSYNKDFNFMIQGISKGVVDMGKIPSEKRLRTTFGYTSSNCAFK